MVMQLIDHDFCVRQVAEERLGGIDYLVLNHIMPLPMAEWTANATNFALLHQVMNINFKAYVYLASYALPVLEKTRGSIVVMSSLAGEYNLYPPQPPCWKRPGVALWSCHPWLVSIIYTPPPPTPVLEKTRGSIVVMSSLAGEYNLYPPPRAGKDQGWHHSLVIPGWLVSSSHRLCPNFLKLWLFD